MLRAAAAMAQATVERPAEIVTLDGPVTSVSAASSAGSASACPPPTGPTRSTPGSCGRRAWRIPTQASPVLLNVHGGPFTQYGETFFDEAQLQAAAGFVVVMSNPGAVAAEIQRGARQSSAPSTTVPGTGWGSVDLDDVLSVIDATLDRYRFCDRDRAGMLGGSYGGYANHPAGGSTRWTLSGHLQRASRQQHAVGRVEQ